MENQEIKIFSLPIETIQLKAMAEATFGDYVKGVVDIEKKTLGLGGGLHADIEKVLLENGSLQVDLWGINLHIHEPLPDMVEFDSLINIRPRQNNRSRSVEDLELQRKIISVIKELIQHD